ncbi:MAG TPA: glycolate oxidase subunit GlcE [Rhodanobacteraceae bacterium]|nr:glycolate oxidase subunit GlcE [Rhodanobacteraceae bacterium]
MDGDRTEPIRERVCDAIARNAPLAIRGSGSKAFLGNRCEGEPLDLRGHAGIVSYAPGELVVTARAGTRLADLETALDANGQMLAFEPPRFGPDATLGGTIACALSGPRRASVGAARDFVLGTRVIDGRGEVLRFGGEVIKNVAGYDVSRLMTGAFGTLGVLLDVSLRVVPKPRLEATRVLELDATEALRRVRAWAQRPLPMSATAIGGGRLHVRLSGAESAVRSAAAEIGGEAGDDGFWRALREHALDFFADDRAIWRLSVAPTSPIAEGAQLIEWHGAQRWMKTDADASHLRTLAANAGGHATLFRATSAPADGAFHPLPPALLALHRRLKAELDPHAIFNRGRLHPEL